MLKQLKPKKLFLLTTLWLLLVLSVFVSFAGLLGHSDRYKVEAATSSTINFQARLLTSTGALVPDGYYNVEFKLYSVSSGGTAQWTETYYDSNGVTAGNDNRVRVVNGYLSVYLGSLTSFPSINWDQQEWVSLNIGGTTQTATPTWDGEMSPRLQLTAVPYAFRAAQLAKLTGANTSTLDFATQTGARSILLPDESGTLCIQSSTNCGFATSSGSGSYIQNTTSLQASSNFHISGDGTSDTSLTTPLLQSASGNLTLQANSGTVTLGTSTTLTATNGLTIQPGTTLTLKSTGANAVTLDSGTTGQVLIGTGTANAKTIIIGPNATNTNTTTYQIASNSAGAQSVSIGSTGSGVTANAGTTVSIQAGTGASAISIGTTASVNQVLIGSTNSTSSATIQSGTGSLLLQTQGTGTLGVGNNAVAQNLAIGNTTGSTGITERVGTGNYSLDGVTNSTYNIGASTTTGTITIGGTAQTGNLTLGSSSGTNSVLIGNGAGATTVNIANANTAGAVNIGSAFTTGTISIGGTGAQTGSISLGTGTGAQTISLGTGGTAAKTVTLGSTASSSSTTIQAGSGGINLNNATIETNAGTLALFNTVPTTINFGGAASTLNIGPGSNTATSINLAGGSSNTGCTVDGLTGNLTCSGAISTTNLSGTVGFWSRNNGTTTLQPATSGDSITTSGNISTSGSGTITSASTVTGTTLNGTTGINTGPVAGTQRIDSSGNLVNIGNLTTTGASTFATTGANGFTFKPGTDTSSAFLIQNANATQTLFQVDTSNNNIYIGGSNTAELQTWQTAIGSLTTSLHGGAVASANGYVYYAGGTHLSSVQTAVYYAKISSNGNISSWTTNSTSLPSPVGLTGGIIVNGYFYVVGGANGASLTSVYYAKINPDGSLGTFNSNTSLPTAINFTNVDYYNGYMYVFGGNQANLYYAKVNADGTLGSWTTNGTTLPTNNQYRSSTVVANGYIYAFGGDVSGTAQTTASYALINSDGSVGTWSSLNSLPAVRSMSAATVVNGYVYVVGGANSGGSSINTAAYAKLNTDGTVSTWTTNTTTMPSGGRYALDTISVNGYVYGIGGINVNSDAGVYYASTQRLTVGGSVDLVGLSNGTIDSSSGVGGSLTAGNTYVAGLLQVQGAASFGQNVTVDGALNVAGQVLFQNSSNSTTAFQVQDASGNSYILLNTTSATLNLGNSGVASTVQIGNTTGAVSQTTNIGTNTTASSVNTVNIGSQIGTSPVTIKGGTSGITLNPVGGSSNTGVLVKPQSDTTAALLIQNSSGSILFSADTGNSQLNVTAASTTTGAGVSGGSGSGISGDNGGGAGGAIGAVNGASNGHSGGTGAQSVDISGLFSVLSSVGGYPTTSPGTAGGLTAVYCTVPGGAAIGFGTGGGGAGWYGGNGGNGLYGGGGGGAAGGSGCSAFTGGNGGQGVVVISFSDGTNVVRVSGTSYTVPSGATSAKIWVIGAGGGGAGVASNADNTSAGGGGAGGVIYRTFNVVPSSTIAYTLGSGGTGGTGAANGSSGGNTTVTVGVITLTASGGSGGQTNNNATGSGGSFSGDSTVTPFQVQNSSGASLLAIDATNNQVIFGNSGLADGKIVFNNATNSNNVTLVSGATSASYSLTLPTSSGSAGQCLQLGGVTTQLQFGACGTSTGLAKNAADSSSAAVSAAANLYNFTNSSSAVASGVLKLDNGTNTASTLKVTASGNPTSGNALIFVSNTNASPSGNLLDLQSGSSPASVFSVNANGQATLKTPTDSTTALQVLDHTASPVLVADTVNASVGIGTAPTSNDKLSLASSGENLITANTTGGSNNLLQLQKSSVNVVTVGNTGATIFKNSTDSTAAFQIQTNTSSLNLFTADTSGKKIQIGSSTSDANAILTILDSYNTTDPTGTNGAMYYSTLTNTFRCYENGAWKNCIDPPSNASTADQSIGASTTAYLTNSNINIPASGVHAGSTFTWRVTMSKTAAGTVANTFDVRFGTNGTTSDASRCSFTQGTQTVVADTAVVDITVTVRSVSATGVIACNYRMTHNLATTGFDNTLQTKTTNVTSGTFDDTVANSIIGLSYTTGASYSITVQQVQVTTTNL